MSPNPRWSARQRAMLDAMGVRWWSGQEPPFGDQDTGDQGMPVAGPETAPVAAPVGSPAAPAPSKPQPAPGLAASAPVKISTVDATGLDLPALNLAIQACRACGLCEARQQAVPGVGAVPARWMVVGEAPGEQEDLQGEPFVGPAGQLLDAMLRAIGLDRRATEPERQVFIANAVKCRPPRNRNPDASELAACQPYLLRQIELVQPRAVLLFGRVAAQSLLGLDEPLGKLRGRVHRLADGRPAIVTYHPAYLLRQPQDKTKAWEDLCLALDTFEANEGPP